MFLSRFLIIQVVVYLIISILKLILIFKNRNISIKKRNRMLKTEVFIIYFLYFTNISIKE